MSNHKFDKFNDFGKNPELEKKIQNDANNIKNISADSYHNLDYRKKKIKKIVDKNPNILDFNLKNQEIDILEHLLSNYNHALSEPFLELINNEKDKNYLHLAVQQNKPNEFITNLCNYVDINKLDTYGRTAIFYSRCRNTVDKLINEGVDLNIVDNKENTFYHHILTSFTKQYLEAKDLFFETDILEKFNINLQNKKNQTILFLAISQNYYDLAKSIIKSKNFHIKDLNFRKPDHFMLIMNSNFNITKKKKLMLQLSKKDNTDNILLVLFKYFDKYHNIFSNMDILNQYIEYIILNSTKDKIKIFLETFDENRDNIFHKISSVNNDNLIKFLLRKKFDSVINVKNKNGEYPIDVYDNNSIEKQMNKLCQ